MITIVTWVQWAVLALVGATGPATAQGVQPAAVASPAAAVAADYIIGPGDVLQVFVWRNPELSVTVPVRPDGRVSTPLVEDMVAVGKTPSTLARDIEKVLAEYIRSPQVNVIVATPVGTLSQVKAVGQVKLPQGVAFHEGMRVLDLLLSTGGMTDFGLSSRSLTGRRGTVRSTACCAACRATTAASCTFAARTTSSAICATARISFTS